MAKVALITDTHWGARNDNSNFLNYFRKFYYNQFFPHILEIDIKTIVHLGDLCDRRKYMNYLTLSGMRDFFTKTTNEGIDIHCIVGNHDTYFKSTNEINSQSLLLREHKNVFIHSAPTDVELDGLSVTMLPWICPDNYEETMNHISSTRSQIAMGHLEISGFEMYRGMPNHEGLSISTFDKFDMVFSGHFHHKSSYGNIHYLGAPYEMTWSDWNDPRGYHIFDTETRELQFYRNKFRMFNKLYYDDSDEDLEKVLDIDTDELAGHVVKVIVQKKNNPYWFDMYISKIEKSGVQDLQVVEDNFYLDLETDEEIVEDIEDTLTILNKYTEQYEGRVDVNRLKSFLKELHQEALSVE